MLRSGSGLEVNNSLYALSLLHKRGNYVWVAKRRLS